MPKGGQREGAGRPNTENITFSVRGHKNVIEKTREFARQESKKEQSKSKNNEN